MMSPILALNTARLGLLVSTSRRTGRVSQSRAGRHLLLPKNQLRLGRDPPPPDEGVSSTPVVRRLPAWLCGRFTCPWGEVHAYYPDGSFHFSCASQSMGIVSKLLESDRAASAPGTLPDVQNEIRLVDGPAWCVPLLSHPYMLPDVRCDTPFAADRLGTSRTLMHLHTFIREANRGQGVGVTFSGVRVSYRHLGEVFSAVCTIVFFVSHNWSPRQASGSVIETEIESQVNGDGH